MSQLKLGTGEINGWVVFLTMGNESKDPKFAEFLHKFAEDNTGSTFFVRSNGEALLVVPADRDGFQWLRGLESEWQRLMQFEASILFFMLMEDFMEMILAEAGID